MCRASRSPWFRYVRIENLLCDRHQTRVRDPRAVVTGSDLAELIRPDLIERALVRLRVVLDRDLGGHSAHGVDSAPVASPDQEVHIGFEKMALHRDLRTIRKHEVGPVGGTF